MDTRLHQIWDWVDDRTGLAKLIGPLMGHLVPPGAKWLYVFGTATLTAFIVQVVTGIALATVYVPSANSAYSSLQWISHDALFGHILRGMHYFGASMMMLFIGVHTLRVFLMAAYKFPREMSWISGVMLLGVVLVMAFTGQLLRWDQDAIWSVVVAAKQAALVPWIGKPAARFVLAGDTVGGATLTRFFGYHVFFVPALIFGLIALHLYLVLRNGISEPPGADEAVDPRTYRQNYHQMLQREGKPFWPEAMWRDMIFSFALIAFILAMAWFAGPPRLGRPPDPTIIQAYPRPDWYFLWYFAVLAMLPHGTEPYIIVGGPLLFFIVMFVVPFLRPGGQRSPLRRPWAILASVTAVLIVASFWWMGVVAPWSPHFDAKPLTAQMVGTTRGPVALGGKLFHVKGCEYCHTIDHHGGLRGPDLTTVGQRLTPVQMTIRIMNGGNNMPAFGPNLSPDQLDDLVAFLRDRK